jgi:hypothetical protein
MSDAKEPLLPQTQEDAMPRRPSAKRFSRFHATAIAILLGVFWLATTWKCEHHHGEDETGTKVPLEVHIMSKCPDARDCLQKLVLPAMQNVSAKVEFRLSFIGK